MNYAEEQLQNAIENELKDKINKLTIEKNSLDKWLDTAKKTIKELEEENKILRNAMKVVTNLL